MSDATIRKWTWVARVLTLLGVLAGIMGAAQQLPAAVRDYAALAVSMLGAGAAWIYSFLPAGKMPPAPKLPPAATAVFIVGLLAVVAAMALPACKASSMRIATQTVRHVQQARELTGKQLAAAMRAAHARCLLKHGAKTTEFKACVKPVLDAQDKWRKYARPVVDTSADSAKTALKTKALVDACKKAKDCHKRVLAFLRSGYCALSRGLKSFGHFLSDKGSAVLGALTVFEGVICGD
jgi:hypothetical protein